MLAERIISRFESSSGEDMSYARVIASERPSGFWKLALQVPLVQHRGSTPVRLVHLAQLGSVQAEDCGPCVQTGINQAVRAGVPRSLLRQALDGGADLPELERDAFFFGRGIAGKDPIDAALRERLEAAIGRTGIVDLTIAAAAVRIFPALKRGLGYARSCSLVTMRV